MILLIAASILSTWGLILLFTLLEAYAPAEPGQGVRGRAFNLVYYGALIAVSVAVLRPVTRQWHETAGYWLTGERDLPFEPAGGIAGQIAATIVYAIVWDIWRYWVHRLQHEVPLLWLTHRFHHTETAVNASTHGRHHLFSDIISSLAYVPMFILLSALAPHPAAMFVLFGLWGYVIHLNVRVSFGRATLWLAGPQWHRIHHSVEAQHLHRNYATFFPWIDRLFGTYYAPLPEEYPRTGLVDRHAGDLREATIQPLVDGARMMARSTHAEARSSIPYGQQAWTEPRLGDR